MSLPPPNFLGQEEPSPWNVLWCTLEGFIIHFCMVRLKKIFPHAQCDYSPPSIPSNSCGTVTVTKPGWTHEVCTPISGRLQKKKSKQQESTFWREFELCKTHMPKWYHKTIYSIPMAVNACYFPNLLPSELDISKQCMIAIIITCPKVCWGEATKNFKTNAQASNVKPPSPL